jgi:hypothetical protein
MSSRDRLLYGSAMGAFGHRPFGSQGTGSAFTVSNPRLAGAPLEPGQRGVMIGPPLIANPDGSLTTTSLDRPTILSALLFWDVIDYPSNTMIDIEIADIDTLAEMGVARRSHIGLSGTMSGHQPIATAASQAIKLLSERDPGRWSVWRAAGTIEFGPAGTTTDAATVKLTQSIVLPPVEAPFEDVLDFKERRRSELLALRAHLDDLGATIAAKADSERAFVVAKDRLVASLDDARRAMLERYANPITAGFEFSFSLTDAAKAVLYGGGGAGLLNPHPLVIAGGALLGGLSASIKPRRKAEAHSGTNPFDVICTMENELFPGARR